MTGETFDAVVIGAGVAGAAFAGQAASSSRRVLLVERSSWPRSKVCGCCLNRPAVGALKQLGLSEAVLASAVRIESLRLLAQGRTAALETAGRGLALSRMVLDDLLVQHAVGVGAEFRPGTAAAITGPAPSGWTVTLRGPGGTQTVTTRLVVAADGLNGSSLSELPQFHPAVSRRAWFGIGGTLIDGTPNLCRPGEIAMHIGPYGYVGLVRLDAQTVNLAAAVDPAWTRRIGGPVKAASAILSQASGAAIELNDAPLRGTAHLTRRRPRVSEPGLLVIGDAAGYVEPFTGEGMAWALAGAEAAAGMVTAGLNGARLAEAWARWHVSHIRSRQRTCTVMREVLRRPRLVGCTLAVMNAIPAFARGAAALARSIERPYSVASPASSQGSAA